MWECREISRYSQVKEEDVWQLLITIIYKKSCWYHQLNKVLRHKRKVYKIQRKCSFFGKDLKAIWNHSVKFFKQRRAKEIKKAKVIELNTKKGSFYHISFTMHPLILLTLSAFNFCGRISKDRK